VDSSYRKSPLIAFRSFPLQTLSLRDGNLVVVLTSAEPSTYNVAIKNKIITTMLRNVVGVIPVTGQRNLLFSLRIMITWAAVNL
jgi:hypothetical protein